MSITLPQNYRPTDREPFMNAMQQEYFRQKLLKWKSELIDESNQTLQNMQEESLAQPDLADRAEASRGASDRYPLSRGAGAPRALGAHTARRGLGFGSSPEHAARAAAIGLAVAPGDGAVAQHRIDPLGRQHR